MRYLVFAQSVTEDILMLLGAVPAPDCFSPTDDFLRITEEMGLRAAIQSAEEIEEIWGIQPDEVYLEQGRRVLAVLDNVRLAEKASLN